MTLGFQKQCLKIYLGPRNHTIFLDLLKLEAHPIQFPNLQNGYSNSTYLMELLRRVNNLIQRGRYSVWHIVHARFILPLHSLLFLLPLLCHFLFNFSLLPSLSLPLSLLLLSDKKQRTNASAGGNKFPCFWGQQGSMRSGAK